MSAWVTASASVIGSSHVATGVPCQDACVIKTTKADEWVVIVVSDGAGTASRAEEGARHVVKFFSEELLKLVTELNKRSPGHWINDFVIEKVLQTRNALRQMAASDDIRDFNSTVVACLLGPSGGFAIHIGDGSIVGGYRSELVGVAAASLFVSAPENGEYANETFFITEGDWVKHLRVTPMPKMDWVLCCTDGGSSLALATETEIKYGFLGPVIQDVFSITDGVPRSKKLATYLSDPQADKVTGDDKSLAIAVKLGDMLPLDQYVFNAKNAKKVPLASPAQDAGGGVPMPLQPKRGKTFFSNFISEQEDQDAPTEPVKSLKRSRERLRLTVFLLSGLFVATILFVPQSLFSSIRGIFTTPPVKPSLSVEGNAGPEAASTPIEKKPTEIESVPPITPQLTNPVPVETDKT